MGRRKGGKGIKEKSGGRGRGKGGQKGKKKAPHRPPSQSLGFACDKKLFISGC